MRLAIAALLFSLPATADYPGPHKVALLNEGMPMAEVAGILGGPDRSESSTCGQKSKKGPWPCRLWHYEGEWGSKGVRYLTIRFQREGDAWVVNGWIDR